MTHERPPMTPETAARVLDVWIKGTSSEVREYYVGDLVSHHFPVAADVLRAVLAIAPAIEKARDAVGERDRLLGWATNLRAAAAELYEAYEYMLTEVGGDDRWYTAQARFLNLITQTPPEGHR